MAHLYYTRNKTRPDNDGEVEDAKKPQAPDGMVPEVYAVMVEAVHELQPTFDAEEYIG